MNTKKKILLAGIIITSILLFTYISLRFGMIEREYAGELAAESASMGTALRQYGSEGPVAGKDLTKFFEYAAKTFDNIAMIAVKDQTNRILVAGRNESFIDT